MQKPPTETQKEGNQSAIATNKAKNIKSSEPSDDEDEEEDEDEQPAKPVSKPAAKVAAKKAQSDDEEDEEDDEDDEEDEAPKKPPTKVAAKPATKPAAKAAARKDGDDDDDEEEEESEEESEEEATVKVSAKKAPAKSVAKAPVKPAAKPKAAVKVESESEESDEEDSQQPGKSAQPAAKSNAKKSKEDLDDILAEFGAPASDKSGLSKAQQKRLRQKEAAEKAKAEAPAGAVAASSVKKAEEKKKEAAPAPAAKKAEAKKPDAKKKGIAGMKAIIQQQREAEAKAIKDLEDAKAAAEAEAKRELEEKARKEQMKIPEEEKYLELEAVESDSPSEEDDDYVQVPVKSAHTKDSWEDESDDEGSSSKGSAGGGGDASAISSEKKAASKARREARQKIRDKNKQIEAENAKIRARNEQRKKKIEEERRKEQERRKEEEQKKEQEQQEKDAKQGKQVKHGSGDTSTSTSGSESKKSGRDLRSPICVVMGHVDAGKTKILDNLRHSNVGMKEAGGITQQIGATYFPMTSIDERTKEIRNPDKNLPIPSALKKDLEIRYPGLLVIDTPGHESFTNLRSRGSSLCDIAILVVDIKSGIQRQTEESIDLLKQKKTPFIIALNKVDRMYGWQANKDAPFLETLVKQKEDAQLEFKSCVNDVKLQFSKLGLNTYLYYENPNLRSNFSIVPVSAATGEGMPDLLLLLTSLTQMNLNDRLQYNNTHQCIVLEVKVVEGLGTTLDVILVNGVLREGDTILVCGLNGPITTTIRSLLTPAPLAEMRVKSEFQHHKEVRAAMGIKISAHGLDGAVAGSQLLVVRKEDNLEDLKDEVMADLQTILSKVGKTKEGIHVQASTLGSMEAMLTFLEAKKIPVSGIALGPVYKHNVMKCAVQLEHRIEYATILAFDVKVTAEANHEAEVAGVKILQSDVIYTLFDQCNKYFEQIREMRREETKDEVVFPVVLQIMKDHVYRIKNPIVIGCRVMDGTLRLNTPLVVPAKNNLFVGRVMSIQKNHEDMQTAKKDDEVAVKIGIGGIQQTSQIQFGRHFNVEHDLVSRLTRESIDLLKENYKEDLSEDEWKSVIRIKKLLGIP